MYLKNIIFVLQEHTNSQHNCGQQTALTTECNCRFFSVLLRHNNIFLHIIYYCIDSFKELIFPWYQLFNHIWLLRWYLILKVVQACLFLVSSSKCFISCLQMCNIILYSYSIIRFFFKLSKPKPSKGFGNNFFLLLGLFFFNIIKLIFMGIFVVRNMKALKCVYTCEFYLLSVILSMLLSVLLFVLL